MATFIHYQTSGYTSQEKINEKMQNLELRIKLDQAIDKIEKRLTKINKQIHKTFNEYCSYREQIIEFKGRYYDLYLFHCK